MDICEKTTFSEGTYDRHPWELARIKVVENILKKTVKIKSGARILDLGCGDAYVALQLSKQFSTASFHCVDTAFTPEIITELSANLGKHPISLYPSLEDLKADLIAPVDVVLLLDVIEHIEDEIGFLQHLRNSGIIDKHTKVIITVPAFQYLFSNHDVYLKHFRRYNANLLNNHLEKAGFKSAKTGYFFISLLFVRLLQKMFIRNRSVDKEKGIGAYQSKGILDKIIVNVLYFDFLFGKFFRFFGLRIPGLSCFSICRIQQS
ncbi:hypothetical protein CW751_01710 [Brumimicrobium salinarum]|uniref:Methyltransferase domain-containing protein n=1 Tax=Brumimicrobium salinarum TaxID=2058658 RepID=A0A2I0R685_9FLAO|nr:class I SAM-dependent methyltransferase [Brumimicrobium salinarum]PKR82079.1 hypothetical protein CW751_01710 [Brumimicrobium salinarum]